MEFRVWITVPGLPDAEKGWIPLARRLERDHGELGPILGGTEHGPCVIVADDAASAGEARDRGVAAVVASLQAVGLGALRPGRVDVEPVSADESPAAA